MATRTPEERTGAFIAALGEAPTFGGLGDLYAYEIEIEAPEPAIEIVEELSADDFQRTEEPTAIMPAARLVERCTTSAALSAPPPLPAEERLRAFRAGVRRALERADLEALIPYVFAHGEAFPGEPKEPK